MGDEVFLKFGEGRRKGERQSLHRMCKESGKK